MTASFHRTSSQSYKRIRAQWPASSLSAKGCHGPGASPQLPTRTRLTLDKQQHLRSYTDHYSQQCFPVKDNIQTNATFSQYWLSVESFTATEKSLSLAADTDLWKSFIGIMNITTYISWLHLVSKKVLLVYPITATTNDYFHLAIHLMIIFKINGLV